MRTAGLIVAAGRGQRLGGDDAEAVPAARPATGAAAARSRRCSPIPAIDLVQVVDPPRRPRALRRRARRPRGPAPAPAGRTAAPAAPDSVLAGLEALAARGARPGADPRRRAPVRRAAARRGRPRGPRRPPGRPARRCRSSTRSGAAPTGSRAAPAPRDGLWRAQTPQGFRFAEILAAHRARTAATRSTTRRWRAPPGSRCALVAGRRGQLQDHHRRRPRRAPARASETTMDIRTGNGFDVHAFGPGDGVTLCGVAIPFERGLVGHSDADVGMHALTDAIFGALAEGDIGQWFPPSDPAWKGAASEIFLRKAVERATRPRLRRQPPRLHAGLRGAEDRPARRGDARGARPHRRHRARADQRQGDHLRAARLHRPRRGHRRARHRHAGAARDPLHRHLRLCRASCRAPPAPGARWRRCRSATSCTWLGGFPLLARAPPLAAYGARHVGDPGRDLRAGRPRPLAHRDRRGGRASGSR